MFVPVRFKYISLLARPQTLSPRKPIVKIAISGFALTRDLNTTQGQLQISKTCTIEKTAPNDTRRPQWPPKANGALNPPRQGIHHARDLSSRGARRSVGSEDLRTRQSSLRAAGGYAGGGRAGSNRQATPALVASAAPSTDTTPGSQLQLFSTTEVTAPTQSHGIFMRLSISRGCSP